MFVRTRLLLPVVLSSLAILAACGGSNNSNPPVNPPPSGGFSNSNLNGNYVFSVTGTAASNDFLTIAGVFTADGQGHITSGVLDQNSTAAQGGLILDTITSGAYNIGADGRATGTSAVPTGLITLNTQKNGTFQFAYVLTSSAHGLITEFENFGSASGTLDLQANVTQSQIAGQSYVFNLTGSSGIGSDICGISTGGSATPFSTVGAFTLDANGNVTSGVQDFNNNCLSSGSTNMAMTGDIDLSTFPGTAKLTTGTGASAVTYTFDVYPLDATHLKLIEIDPLPATTVLVGDVFTQSSSLPNGNTVFTIAGFDTSLSGPFTSAGIFHFDSNGNILSDSFQDINDVGNVAQFGAAAGGAAITAISTPLTGGRTEITFTSGFVNGNGGTACSSNCIFAAYPSTGGLQLLEIDDGGSTNGIAYPQSATSLASGASYGMNLSGATTSSSEDDVAQFTNNNGAFSGIIDINDQGSTNFRSAFSGSYSADTTIAGRGSVVHTNNAPLLTTYVIDNSTAVTVSADTGFVGLGALVTQNASAKSNVVASHLSVLRIRPSAHAARKKPQPGRTR